MQKKAVDAKEYAVLLPAIVHTAAQMTWTAAGMLAVLCLGAVCAVNWLGIEKRRKPWVQSIAAWWGIALVVQSMAWTHVYWPGETSLIPLAGLVLATWCAWKGKDVATRAVMVLRYFIVPLVLLTLLAGVMEIRSEQLLPKWGMASGELAAVLLAVSSLGDEAQSRKGMWLIIGTVALVPAIVGGILPEAWTANTDAFYQYSRSISLIGAVKRFEGLAAAGITLGFMAMQCDLLGRIGSENGKCSNRYVLLASTIAAGMYLIFGRFRPELLVIGSVAVYLLLPMATFRISEKRIEKRY